jgi:hypothetical protein
LWLTVINSYQPGGSSGFTSKLDPLSDPDVCLRDAALMQRLGVSTALSFSLFISGSLF